MPMMVTPDGYIAVGVLQHDSLWYAWKYTGMHGNTHALQVKFSCAAVVPLVYCGYSRPVELIVS